METPLRHSNACGFCFKTNHVKEKIESDTESYDLVAQKSKHYYCNQKIDQNLCPDFHIVDLLNQAKMQIRDLSDSVVALQNRNQDLQIENMNLKG